MSLLCNGFLFTGKQPNRGTRQFDARPLLPKPMKEFCVHIRDAFSRYFISKLLNPAVLPFNGSPKRVCHRPLQKLEQGEGDITFSFSYYIDFLLIYSADFTVQPR